MPRTTRLTARPACRLALVRRSRHLGLAVLRSSTLLFLETRRVRQPKDIRRVIGPLVSAYAVDEIVLETGGRLPAPAGDLRPAGRPVAVVRRSIARAKDTLLPPAFPHTHRHLFAELFRRFPALHRPSPRGALSRDRVTQLLAVALALCGADEKGNATNY